MGDNTRYDLGSVARGLANTSSGNEKTVQTVQTVAQGEGCPIPPTPQPSAIDPSILNSQSTKIVRFHFVNTLLTTVTAWFGVVADPTEGPGLGLSAAEIAAMANGNPGVTDDYGVGTPKLVQFAKRVQRQPLVINKITVFADNAAVNVAQKGQPFRVIEIDMDTNRLSDRGQFIRLNVEDNFSSVKTLKALANLTGLTYDIRPGAEIDVQFDLNGIDVPNFRNYGGC